MSSTRRTIVQTLTVPAGGLALSLGRNPLALVAETSRIVEWQISPSPTGSQTQTWIRLGGVLPFSATSPPEDAICLSAGESLQDSAKGSSPDQTCAVFPVFIAALGAPAVVRLVMVLEEISGCGCGCKGGGSCR
jgi:hypothetical protein